MTTEIVFKSDIEYELRKMILTLYEIKTGFFTNTNFKLSKTLYKNSSITQNGYLVVIPEKLYKHLITDFNWDLLDLQSGDSLNDTNIDKFLYLKDFLDYKIIEPLWDLENLQKVIKILTDFFDVPVKTVDICPTNYGTMGSFTPIDNNPPLSIRLYPRIDAPYLYRSFTGMYIRMIYPNRAWKEYQSLQNFLIDKTVLKRFTPNDIVVKDKPPEQPDEVLTNHLLMFKELGFPLNPLLSLKNHTLELENYGKVDFLTPKEDKILKMLVTSQPNHLSFDDIGNALWIDADDFSMQAITKTIERIRKKLRDKGIIKNLIHTIYGKGYRYSE